jgi:hypothetical protein
LEDLAFTISNDDFCAIGWGGTTDVSGGGSVRFTMSEDCSVAKVNFSYREEDGSLCQFSNHLVLTVQRCSPFLATGNFTLQGDCSCEGLTGTISVFE